MFNYSWDIVQKLAEAIAEEIKVSEKSIGIIASSDMTHYESADFAREQDFLVIPKIEALDTAGVFETVNTKRISMCGLGPIGVTMEACKKLGVTRGKLIIYTHSGETCAPESQEVVGYAGIIFK